MHLYLILVGIVAIVNAATVSAQWSLVGIQQDPGKGYGFRSIYCTNRDSMVLFGGYKPNPATGRFDYSNDLFEYSFLLKKWTKIDLPVKPSPRLWFTFTALDVDGEQECAGILYGGYGPIPLADYSPLSDTWYLNLTGSAAAWTPIHTSTAGPGPRYLADAVNRRGSIVLFGGATAPDDSNQIAFNDMWTFTLGTYDSAHGNWTASTWTETVRPSTSSWPDPRFQHTMSMSLGATADLDQLVLFAGRRMDGSSDPPTTRMNSDLLVYTFASNSWRTATGLKIERAAMSSTVFNGRFMTFGGFTQLQPSPPPTNSFVFNNILTTTLTIASLSAPPGTQDQPQCVADDGRTGLWCVATVDQDSDVPVGRFDYAAVVRNDLFIVYGGKSQSSAYSDFWALNLTLALDDLKLAEADSLGSSDLASTMYFMIAILSMMVICFMIFVISLRRQRGNTPIFQTMMINRPRIVGARQSVIEALPLKTYRKKEAEERRASRRLSRIGSQAPRDGSMSATATSSAAASESAATAVAPAANPADGQVTDRIDQDDLHDLCAICLTDYEDGEQLRVLPCDHFFHPPCVDQWLRTHNACPMCKASVDPDPERSDEPAFGTQVVVSAQSAENPHFGTDGEGRATASDATAMMPRDAASSLMPREGASSIMQQDAASSLMPREGASSIMQRDAASSVVPRDGASSMHHRETATSIAPRAEASSSLVVIDLSSEENPRQSVSNNAVSANV